MRRHCGCIADPAVFGHQECALGAVQHKPDPDVCPPGCGRQHTLPSPSLQELLAPREPVPA